MWLSSFDDIFGNGFGEIRRIQRDLNRIFGGEWEERTQAWPPMDAQSDESRVTLTFELPGIDPSELDITVVGKTITVKGSRSSEPLAEGEKVLRRERNTGSFARTVALPFAVNSNEVEANYREGVLTVVAPRAAEDRPRRIQIN